MYFIIIIYYFFFVPIFIIVFIIVFIFIFMLIDILYILELYNTHVKRNIIMFNLIRRLYNII
jgi:hypothetical protein